MYRMLLLIATLMTGLQAAYADVRIGILMPQTGAGSRYGQEQRVAVACSWRSTAILVAQQAACADYL